MTLETRLFLELNEKAIELKKEKIPHSIVMLRRGQFCLFSENYFWIGESGLLPVFWKNEENLSVFWREFDSL